MKILMSIFLIGLIIVTGCEEEQILREDATECKVDSDCVAASCCHASSCVPKESAPNCQGVACTMSCEPETMDCGEGSCQCVEGKCDAVFN